MRVPTPIVCGVAGDVAFLALEWLDIGHGGRDAALGRCLAQLHRTTGPRFGWHRDNTIGTTPQVNAWEADWATFYRDRRIFPQLALAARNGHRGTFYGDGERLLAAIPALLAGHAPPPSLLHGDLWSGNAAQLASGEPVIFDPAVSLRRPRGRSRDDRTLRRLRRRFLRGLSRSLAVARRPRAPPPLYNLYHVLNHLNLFGGGYLAEAGGMISRLLALVR